MALLAVDILKVSKRILASVIAFLRHGVTPQSLEPFERRLEKLFREKFKAASAAKRQSDRILAIPRPVTWKHRVLHPWARRERSMVTRAGTIRDRRRLNLNEYFFAKGIAPLNASREVAELLPFEIRFRHDNAAIAQLRKGTP